MNPWKGDIAYAYSKVTPKIQSIEIKEGSDRVHKLLGSKTSIDSLLFHASGYVSIRITSHQGWVNTPGVQNSLPDFHKFLGDKLRTQEQGIDTIIWSAVSTQVKSDAPNGSFIFGII